MKTMPHKIMHLNVALFHTLCLSVSVCVCLSVYSILPLFRMRINKSSRVYVLQWRAKQFEKEYLCSSSNTSIYIRCDIVECCRCWKILYVTECHNKEWGGVSKLMCSNGTQMSKIAQKWDDIKKFMMSTEKPKSTPLRASFKLCFDTSER